MTAPETTYDYNFSQLAAGFADMATLLAEAAQELSDAACAMSDELRPAPLVSYQASVDETGSVDPNAGLDHDSSKSQLDAEDANVGNNIYRPNSIVGTLSPPASPTNTDLPDLRAEREPTLTTQDTSRDIVLPPGRYYVVLEEEFDVLPLIAAYASICQRMLCCMPFTESSQSWRVLLSAICPDHEVLEVSSEPSAFSSSTATYMSSNKPSLLIQSLTTWQTRRTVSSISDSLLMWGFLNVGDEQLSRIQDAVLSTQHTCAIVTSQEYERPSIKRYLTSLGFTEHPGSSSINNFDQTNYLHDYRTAVQGILQDPKYQTNVYTLYKAFLKFYSFSSARHIYWPGNRLVELANLFAARILLHGRKEDGSLRYEPNGRIIPVDQNLVDKFGLESAALQGLIQKDTVDRPDSACLLSSSDPPSNSATSGDTNYVPSPAGRWYIDLQEDFDAIPFICYQVEQYSKVVCFVSHGTTAEPYKDILELMSNRHVLRPGHSNAGVKAGIISFESLQSAVLLLRGIKANLHPDDNSLHVKADVAIHWGAPPEPHLTARLNTVKAKYTYILLSSGDDLGARQRTYSQNGVTEYSESKRVNSTGPESLLHSYRGLTHQTMVSIKPKIPQIIYENQIQRVQKALDISVRESVLRANRFVARVLLHGDPADGSTAYPPIHPRPAISIKPKIIARGGLQPFIDEGLIRVGLD